MKTYCLFVIIFILSCNPVSGEIKNGYKNEIMSRRLSLKGLNDILRVNNKLSLSEKRKIQDKIKSLINYITYYEITENLLNQFRIIAPDLYNEIDTIKDSKGRITDVYVKFIPKEGALVQAAGITSLSQAASDMNTCRSEYGEGTVSVGIWVVSNALWVLSHELGHVKYQVPNLAGYIEYFKNNYRGRLSDPNNVGHNSNDPSGKSAMAFVKRFNENYTAYLKIGNKKSASPLHLIGDIRKKIELGRQRV